MSTIKNSSCLSDKHANNENTSVCAGNRCGLLMFCVDFIMAIKKQKNQKKKDIQATRLTLSHHILSYIGILMAIAAFFAILYAVNSNTDIRSQAANCRGVGSMCSTTAGCCTGLTCVLGINDGRIVNRANVGYCKNLRITPTPTPKPKGEYCKYSSPNRDAWCDKGYKCVRVSLFSANGYCKKK
jgi:hypothetical protein